MKSKEQLQQEIPAESLHSMGLIFTGCREITDHCALEIASHYGEWWLHSVKRSGNEQDFTFVGRMK